MAQCSSEIQRDGDDASRRCRRHAVTGSTFCQAHGGVKDTTTPEKVRVRKESRRQIQCTATSKRTGEQCQSKAILGGTVCRMHGGATPNVKKKAREHMEALIRPAIEELETILSKPDTSDSDRLRAITLLLDRTGFGPKAEVAVEVKKYEEISVAIMRELPEDAEIIVESSDDESIESNIEDAQIVSEGELEQATGEVEVYPAPIPLMPRIVGSANPPRHLQ